MVERQRRTADAVIALESPEDLDQAVDDLMADLRASLDEFRARMRDDPQAIDEELVGPLIERAVSLGFRPRECD